jgi:hypothetical protein
MIIHERTPAHETKRIGAAEVEVLCSRPCSVTMFLSAFVLSVFNSLAVCPSQKDCSCLRLCH